MSKIEDRIEKMKVSLKENGKYVGRLTVGGRRRYFYGSTESEVRKRAYDCYSDIENGCKDADKITLSKYMLYWLENYKWGYVEPSTYTRLYSLYEHQIKGTDLGECMLDRITNKMIKEVIDEHANPTKSKTIPLSKSGLKKLKQLINACLNIAVEEKILTENPCENIRIPTESYIKKSTKQMFTLSDEQIEEFKKVALTQYKTTDEYISKNGLILLIMLNLGLRVGEMLALEWSDIDRKSKLIHITKTIQSNVMVEKDNFSKRVTYVRKGTKTYAGKRVLKINDNVMFYFTELEAYNERNNIKSSYICSTNTGTIITARNLQRSLDRYIDRTQIGTKTPSNVSLHTLRHTFGSVLIRRGVPIEVVSKLMGHSSITVTYNKYIHVLQEQQVKTMDMITIC